MLILERKPAETTWYVYDQFSFDPLAEFRFPNKEVHLRRVQTVDSPVSKLYSREIFSGQTPEDPLEGEDPTQLGHRQSGAGRYAYFYTDHRYDVSSILKHSGQSLHSYLYDEYGMMYDNNQKPRDSSNFTQSHNLYTFSQKEFDPESSLSYFGARSYDAFSGTWTIATNSRRFLLTGQKLITLVQSEDPRIEIAPVGACPVMWNQKEWLNKNRGL